MKNGTASPRVFGSYRGADVHQVTLGAPDGLQAKIMTWGAVLCDLSLPLGDGRRLSLTLGFDTFDPYPAHSPYFGAVVGRYANRIAGGQYSHAGRTYQLERNEASKTTLHGGPEGFARRVWRIADLTKEAVTLVLTSADGDQGFPGTLDVSCTYSVSADRNLVVDFRATTSAATPVNLAQHAYFNLDGGRDTSDHHLQIFAEAYTPVGPDQIPTGSISPVAGTAFDFRQPLHLRQVQRSFDHNFVLSAPPSTADGLRKAARLTSQKSGIGMMVMTSKPGLQFYDGDQINVPALGQGGRIFGRKAGLCLETQFFPDSPNQPGFPDSMLPPGKVYAHRTVFSFENPMGADLQNSVSVDTAL
ncbi:aldose epimerase family protein [Tabrizicola sp.]|uniref:aldose epimerase family protein n=1 Tax=Tabrizicola sp. TaxID=2005166 RepID=UPI003F2E4CF3